MSLTKFVAVWSILRAVLLGNKQTECCKVENNKKWNLRCLRCNFCWIQLIVWWKMGIFLFIFPKKCSLTCIKIQGFPMKINHLQKWLCLCFLYWFHQLRMAVKAKTLSNFFSVAPLLILDFLSLGRETEIIKILKKKRTKKIIEMFQISLTHVLRSTLPSPISFFCNAIRTFYS